MIPERYKPKVINSLWDRDNLNAVNYNFYAMSDFIAQVEKRIFDYTWEATKEVNTIKMMEPVQTIEDLPENAKPKSLITVIDEQKVYAYVRDEWQLFSEIDLDPFSPFKTELQSMIDTHEKKAEQLLSNMQKEHEDVVSEIKSLTSDFNADYQDKMDALASDYKVKMDNLSNDYNKKSSQLQSDYESYSTQLDTNRTSSLSEISSSKSSSLDEIDQAKQEALDSVTNENQDNWQKYKLTSDDGSRIYLAKGSFDNILDLAPGFYETVVNDGPVSQGFPDFFSNAPFVQIDVTYGNNGRKQFKVVQSFNGQTVYRYIHTDGKSDSGWLEIMTKKTLYDGEVEDANSEFELDGNPGDYSYLIIEINHIGGDDAVIAKAKNNSFVFRAFNLGNSAKGVTLMETTCTVSGSNPSIAKISNSVRVESDTATGKDYVPKILKIVGVK